MNSGYKATIGIECHVQLKTQTKLFSGVKNDARDATPNTLVSPLCFGMPGALPVLNEKAVELAVRAAFALGTRAQKFSKFDRKHYFYPDLPLGYQISQFDQPIIIGGHVDIKIDGQKKRIGVTRAHLEADAGKSIHPAGADYSLVDLNRAGTPLLEIVSEPEMHTPAEAREYAHKLYLLMKYADVSEADLYHGNMRFDVNVSVSKSDELGTRTETKNLNSFRSIEKAVEYEINRQIKVLEGGDEIVQETRGWDDVNMQTLSQRTKEDAHDYRYFPDPDLPPVLIEDRMLSGIESELPVMPDLIEEKFAPLELDSSQLSILLEEPKVALAVVSIIENNGLKSARTISNWLSGDLTKQVADSKIDWGDAVNAMPQMVALADMLESSQLSSTAAREVLAEVVVNGGDPVQIAEARNLIQESDEDTLTAVVQQVLNDNPKAAEDIKSGEMKAVGFLVGQVMKASAGKANPGIAQSIIKKLLGV